ncbi:MAG: HAD family hydrolase [Salinispira sp.]
MKAIVFDLDGTLLYTLQDIAAALNHALKEHGFSLCSLNDIRLRVGNGLSQLVTDSVPPDTAPEQRRSIINTLNNYYRRRPVQLSSPYPGIPELLSRIKRRGILLGLLSNKDDALVHIITEHFFPGLFSSSLGLLPGRMPKPDPATLQEMLKNQNVTANDALFVGDSEVDMETARRAGVEFLGVSWGYRDHEVLEKYGAATIIRTVDDFPIP